MAPLAITEAILRIEGWEVGKVVECGFPKFGSRQVWTACGHNQEKDFVEAVFYIYR